MTKKGWDLHMHSTCSDGTSTPEELIDGAKERGLAGISITDHDTTAAYQPKLISYAKEQGVDLVTGVEFSTMDQELPVHILGYKINPEASSVIELCEAHQKRRKDRNEKMIKKLNQHGIDISYAELESKGEKSIGRPHIAHLLIEKGVVSTVKEAFEKWIGDGKKAFDRGESFSPKDAIDVIRDAEGVAILAHPILYRKKAIIKGLLAKYKFDGMECYYAAFSEDQKMRMVTIAKNHNLLVTGGSDFHGETKPYIKIGASYTNSEDIKKIKQYERM